MKFFILYFFLVLSFSQLWAKGKDLDSEKKEPDAYSSMAAEISSAALNNGIKKAAVFPFSYAVSSETFKEGSVISERLITQLVKEGRLEITERSQLEKVLSELKLEVSGLVEEKTAKQVGKVLGAEAIITGTMIKTADGLVEINARLIKTDDAKVLSAFTRKVPIDWLIKDEEKKTGEMASRRRRF